MSQTASRSLSVVMTTYNGARFLRAQLDSLAAQTRRPDELLVCDDGSTDDTFLVLADFQRVAPFPVRIHRNPTRLGYADNFLHGCTLATGDLIALCDQDDVWRPEKLARCVAEFDASALVELVIHSAEIVDGTLQPQGFAKPDFAVRERRKRHGGDLDISWPGFAMVVSPALIREFDWRNRARDYMKADRSLMAHDQWLFFLARSLGEVVQLPDRLALYRQHGANTCGATPGRSPVPTLQRAANFAAYEQRAGASAYLGDCLTRLAGDASGGRQAALLASAAEYRQQGELYARRAGIYRHDRTFSTGLKSYAGLWRRGAYRNRRGGGLGWRAAVKDASALLLGGQTSVPRREEPPHEP